MKVQPAVRKETRKIAIGTAILSAVMLLVFAGIGQFSLRVVLGTLLGACAAVANFFLLGLSVQRAAAQMNGVTMPPLPDEDEEDASDAPPPAPVPEVQAAKRQMQLSYTGRMLLMVAVGILALTVPCFHPIPAVLALLFPRLVIFAEGIFHKQEEKEA